MIAHALPLLAGVLVLLLAVTGPAAAGGPILVNGGGTPLRWNPVDIPWNPDQGALGLLGNAEAVDLVASSFAVWSAVPTAAVTFAQGPPLSTDVTAATVSDFIGVCSDGRSPIVFDADGSITDALFGIGASDTILGFAGPECGTFEPPIITEASAVLNGRFIDGIDAPGNGEIDLAAFAAVFVHEFGHYLNLDHTQVNLAEAFDGSPANDAAVATMFPFLVAGAEAATLARDDTVAVSSLYPAPGFEAETGRITGRILIGDGTKPFQGAFVVARNVEDPRLDAVGFTSGGRYFPNALGGIPDPALRGAFELAGLTPGAQYTVEVEQIFPSFVGSSSVGPLSVPAVLPGPEEFWNGVDEAGAFPPDDPDAPGVPILVAAGTTVADVDIRLNVTQAPPNDACAMASPVASLPFTTSVDTRAATTALDDPFQTCSPSIDPRNANSVWYRVVAPGDGALTIDTGGSSYDTVVSVHTGVCGLFGPIGCNDDHAGPQAFLTVPVSVGTPYLVAITDFGAPGGGTLAVRFAFDPTPPASCTQPAPGVCIPGLGATTTDCLTEWLVEPVPPTVRSRSARRNVPTERVECRDGDPRCDFDGVSGANGSCTFHVAVCVANSDPRPAAARCNTGNLAAYTVLAPSARRPRDLADVNNRAALTDGIALLGAGFAGPDRCTRYGSLKVPVGNRTIRTRATGTSGKRDLDRLRLTCLP